MNPGRRGHRLRSGRCADGGELILGLSPSCGSRQRLLSFFSGISLIIRHFQYLEITPVARRVHRWNGCALNRDGVQYYIYRSMDGMDGPWPRVGVSGTTSFTDSCPTSGPKT